MCGIKNIISYAYHAASSALDSVMDAVRDACVWVWQEVIAPAVEIVMGLFGVKDKDVVSVALNINKLFSEDYDIVDDIVRAKTTELKSEGRIDTFRDEFMSNINVPSGRLKSFFEHCLKEPLVGTPQLDFSKSNVDGDVIQEKLDSVEDPDGQYIVSYKATGIDAFTLCRFKMRDGYSYEGYRDGFTYDDHEDYMIDSITVNEDNMDIDIKRKHLTKHDSYDLTKTESEIEKGHEISYVKFKGAKYEDGTDLAIDFDNIHIDIDPDANTRLDVMLDWISQYNDNDDRTFNLWIAYEDTEDDTDFVKVFLVSVNKDEDIDDVSDDSFTITQQDDDTFSFYDTTLMMDSTDDNKGSATYTGIRKEEFTANEKWEYSDDPDSSTDTYYRLPNIDIVASDEDLNETVETSNPTSIEEVTYSDNTTITEDYTFNEEDLYLYYEFSEDEDSKDKYNISLYNLTANDEEDLALSRNSEVLTDTMPILLIRNDSVFWDEEYDEDVYKAQKKMCKFLGVDYDDMMNNLKENEDIDKVLDAYIWFYVRPNDTSEIISKYLYIITEYIFNKDISWSNDDLTITNQKILPFRYKKLDCALMWSDLTKEFVDDGTREDREYEHEITDDYLIVRRWLSDTDYIEYKYYDLYSITVITNGDYRGVSNDKPTSDNFPFPLVYSAIVDLPLLDRNQLFYKTLTLTTNALDVQHLEWYQTEEFLTFIEILTVVIIVVVSIMTFGLTTAALMAMAQALLIMIAVKKAIKYVNKHVKTPWLRAVLDVALLVAAAWVGDWNDIVYAVTTTAAITAYGVQTYYQAKTEQVIEDFNDLQEKAKERYEEFDEVRESIEGDKHGLNTEFLAWLNQTLSMNSVLTPEYSPLDNQRYKAISLQTDYAILYDLESKVQVNLTRY